MTSPLATPQTLQTAVAHLQQNDSLLAPVIQQHGLATFQPHSNYYQALVESIISQQLSVKAAATIRKRFIDLFPDSSFPSPSDILKKDVEEYRAVGLSRQKAIYIQDLAVKVLEGTVQFDQLDGLDNDAIIAELTKVKGIGVWTVHMFLMFCMGRLDVLPVGDLGVKNGMQQLYALDHSPTPEEMVAIAQKYKWHPYESVASWYVWRSLENMPILESE